MTPFDICQRYVDLNVKEKPGADDNPMIVWWLALAGLPGQHDETSWCGACINFCVWQHGGLPRPKGSAAARSWLGVGVAVPLEQARPGYDVVILKRGPEPQPGPEVTSGAPGHVGFFAGLDGGKVRLLGGNQGDTVSIVSFAADRVLGVRRLSAAGGIA